MLKIGAAIDNLLNSITMYRLVLYTLIFYAVLSLVFSLFKIIPYTPVQLIVSASVLTIVSLFFNIFFSKLFRAPTNVESVYITALILFFLLLPPNNFNEVLILGLTAFFAIASKFIISTKHKHIFNPAAFGAFLIGILGFGISLWWIGTPSFLVFTLIGGILIVRKIRKFRMVLTFLFITTLTGIIFGLTKGVSPNQILQLMYTSGPIIFCGTIMLTEPSTTPPTGKKQLIYASLVGIFFGSQFHLGPIFSTPELALLMGNIYSYFVSEKEKLTLILESNKKIAKDTYEFVFKNVPNFSFIPGQYFEWTLPHKNADSRGVRRYFTIASSPTEPNIKLGIKFTEKNPSSFKKKLLSLKQGEKITAGQLAGDFLLPKNTNRKFAFIAGGIGITPFRSMIEYLIEKNEKRDIVLFYSNKTADEIAYKDLFEKAEKNGIKIIYLLTEQTEKLKGFVCENGRLNPDIVKKYVPDAKNATFYLSGPNAMVHAYKDLLVKMGVTNIMTDYFPGY